MAKFNFKLQTLLNLKSQQEDNIKNELRKAIQKLENEKAELRSLESEIEANISEFNKKSRKTTVEKLINFNKYISFLNVKIKHQKENVNYASQNVDKVREELIKIDKEHEILDRLKEKKYELFRKELLKEEQRLNDEIVNFRHKENHTGDKDA
jgi:flagellar protein FliJ